MSARKTMEELALVASNSSMFLDATIKTEDHFLEQAEQGGTVMVSISGGSDSDVMLDLIERLGYYGTKVVYVFFNTGLEYEATKRHLDYLELRYGIEILRCEAKVPVAVGCKRYGVPFLSKQVSLYISRLQKHGFQWEDEPFDVLYVRYPNCKAALRFWCNEWGERSRINISCYKWLKKFMVQNPPDFAISDKCCDGAKKGVAGEMLRQLCATLNVIGVRKAEGGVRSTVYNSCFSEGKNGAAAQFRPLFWISDAEKAYYEEFAGIRHSDCYVKYGLKRTGCACCPFGSRFEQELSAAEWFEPKLYKTATAIFGKSYEYTRKYRLFKKQMDYAKRPKDRSQTALPGF